MYFYVAAIPPGLRQFVTVARFSLWLADPDSFLESARSDSRFRRDCFAESCPLWPWSVAHLFIWNDSQFGQPLAQLAIDWEESWAHSHFFLQRTPAHQRNTLNPRWRKTVGRKRSMIKTCVRNCAQLKAGRRRSGKGMDAARPLIIAARRESNVGMRV